MVKFATYNIQYGVGQDGRYERARVIEGLQDQDVICLQEVTTIGRPAIVTCNRTCWQRRSIFMQFMLRPEKLMKVTAARMG